MRLEDADQPGRMALLQSTEAGSDLCRMMGVIVDDFDALHVADGFQASSRAAEIVQRGEGMAALDAKLVRDGERGHGVGHVVPARHVEVELQWHLFERKHSGSR